MSEKFWDSVREENEEKNKVFESLQKEESEKKFRDSVYLAVLPVVLTKYNMSITSVLVHTETIVNEVMKRRNNQ